MKVTYDNVTKVSEHHLYLALEHSYNTGNLGMVELIEAEFDHRSVVESENLKRQQETRLRSLEQLHQIETEVQQIFSEYNGRRTLILIEKLGQQFLNDYVLDEDTFTVYSKVAGVYFENQNSTWEHESLQKAQSKLAGLVYDRIYAYYFREASQDKLDTLKTLLGA